MVGRRRSCRAQVAAWETPAPHDARPHALGQKDRTPVAVGTLEPAPRCSLEWKTREYRVKVAWAARARHSLACRTRFRALKRLVDRALACLSRSPDEMVATRIIARGAPHESPPPAHTPPEPGALRKGGRTQPAIPDAPDRDSWAKSCHGNSALTRGLRDPKVRDAPWQAQQKVIACVGLSYWRDPPAPRSARRRAHHGASD